MLISLLIIIMLAILHVGAVMAAFNSALTPSTTVRAHASSQSARCSTTVAFEGHWRERSAVGGQRCHIIAADDEKEPSLSDEQIGKIFKEFDTSGDGFIDLGELQAALAKAGKPVSVAEAEDMLKRVDANDDGQISLEEFKAVFQDEALREDPGALKGLFGVQGFFLDGLGRVGDALGIDIVGQWRTTASGSRYVDDVLGSGNLVVAGDVVQVHYTMTLINTGRIVETSRGGPPLGFQVGDAPGAVQGWNDAVAGMRIGGQRRVYAKPADGSDGPTVRYDIEIVGLMEGTDRDAREGIITRLGGRRAAFRLLFAATFIPYFLPEQYQPGIFKSEPFGNEQASSDEAFAPRAETKKQQAEDSYVSKQMNALFSSEELPNGLKKK